MVRGLPIQTARDYIQAGGKPPWDTGLELSMWVNHNRWVTECVECAAGIGCDPREAFASCYACGASYRTTAPEHWQTAVRILEERPVKNRHWKGETLDVLRAENLEHGFGADL